jgi:hypothetical protein
LGLFGLDFLVFFSVFALIRDLDSLIGLCFLFDFSMLDLRRVAVSRVEGDRSCFILCSFVMMVVVVMLMFVLHHGFSSVFPNAGEEVISKLSKPLVLIELNHAQIIEITIEHVLVLASGDLFGH